MLIISREGRIKKRLKSVSTKERIFTEDLLQRLIYEEPDLLPTGEIDVNYTQLISLGREVSVRSGSIDVLYLAPHGGLCIVETKLWRNPEAHRTVVAQIIDYAKDLSNMSFLEFCETITKMKGERSIETFVNSIREKLRDINQIELQHNVTEALTHGRFLLLIVGDKIYPELALLTESIRSAPHLEFNLALAELSFYHLRDETDSDLLVVSNLVGRTFETTRAVVKIVYEKKKPEIKVTAIEAGKKGREEKTDLNEFLSSMPEGFADLFLPIFEGWKENGFYISWGTVGFSLRINYKDRLKTVLELAPHYISLYSKKWEKSRVLPTQICEEFRERVARNAFTKQALTENRSYIWYKDMSKDDFGFILSESDKTARELIQFFQSQDT